MFINRDQNAMSDSELSGLKKSTRKALHACPPQAHEHESVKRLYSVRAREDMPPVQAAIIITSFPVAADVEVDGIFSGSAGEKMMVPCGKRRICVSLPGYGRWEKDIVVHQGSKIKVHANLAKSADFRIINE